MSCIRMCRQLRVNPGLNGVHLLTERTVRQSILNIVRLVLCLLLMRCCCQLFEFKETTGNAKNVAYGLGLISMKSKLAMFQDVIHFRPSM